MFDTGTTISTGDTGLFVAEAGQAEAPPIILLHGGMGSRADFAPLARHLVSDYRLVAIDSRGHGRSAKGKAALSYRQLADDVTAVLDRLGLTEAGIIGHSDGGIVALRLAASGLVRPRFVVTIGAHFQLEDDNPTRDLYRDLTVADWREMFGDSIARYEVENPDPDFERLFEQTRAMWLGTGGDAYPNETIRAISAPLLVVNGDEDILVTRGHACALADRVAGARLLNLPFASHSVLEDDPTALLPELTRFLDRVHTRPKPTA